MLNKSPPSHNNTTQKFIPSKLEKQPFDFCTPLENLLQKGIESFILHNPIPLDLPQQEYLIENNKPIPQILPKTMEPSCLVSLSMLFVTQIQNDLSKLAKGTNKVLTEHLSSNPVGNPEHRQDSQDLDNSDDSDDFE